MQPNLHLQNLHLDWAELEKSMRNLKLQAIQSGNGALYSELFRAFFDSARNMVQSVPQFGGWGKMRFTSNQMVINALGTMLTQAHLRSFHVELANPLTLACKFQPSDVDPATLNQFFDRLYISVSP